MKRTEDSAAARRAGFPVREQAALAPEENLGRPTRSVLDGGSANVERTPRASPLLVPLNHMETIQSLRHHPHLPHRASSQLQAQRATSLVIAPALIDGIESFNIFSTTAMSVGVQA